MVSEGAGGGLDRAGSHAGASTSGRGGGSGGGDGAAPPAAGRPRPRGYMRAADKNQLSAEESEEVAARLRAGGRGFSGPGRASGGGGPIRLYRYAVDDLRLLKALDEAGLEGRVVVVDTAEEADAVLAARAKRTGKRADLGPARRAAEARGVPFLLLPNVSGRRVADALAPLLGPEAAAAARAAAAAAAGPAGGWQAPLPPRGGGPGGEADAPRIITREEAEGDGADTLLQLLWGGPPEGGGGGAAAREAAAAAAATAAAGPDAGGGWEPLARRAARLPDPWAWLAAQDPEDDRADALPRNPTARAGARAPPLMRPLRHGSRIQRRKLAKEVEELNAEW
jgi:hypothetical protein